MPGKTPSFIVELPLDVTAGDERRLLGVFEAGKRLLNTVLQDGLRQLDAMRIDPRWAEARAMPKASAAQRKARQALFAAVRADFRFTEYAFQALAVSHKNAAGFDDRLGAHVTQKIGSRVFKALEEHLYGKRGRPRFKGRKRPLHSLEGKNNQAALRWSEDDGCLYVNAQWAIRARLPDLRRDEWLWSALQAPTKYCRVLWRTVRGQRRWYVQLVQEGLAPLKATLAEKLLHVPVGATAGIDIGPSTLAWCTETDAGVLRFCAEVEAPQALIRRLQRQLDRQRRANNPEHFDAAGRAKRGARPWAVSARQRQVEARLAAAQTHAAECRANAHGRDINELLCKARRFRHDGVSAKALQKMYGRSVGARAPGRFMGELQRKAERAGGDSIAVNVRQLKTSQYDHSSGAFKKKPLSQRWHVFGDGRGKVQRDVYSAFLALHARCDDNGAWSYDRVALDAAWAELEPALRARGLFKAQHDVCSPSESGARIALSARKDESTSRKAPKLASVPGRGARGAVRARTVHPPSV